MFSLNKNLPWRKAIKFSIWPLWWGHFCFLKTIHVCSWLLDLILFHASRTFWIIFSSIFFIMSTSFFLLFPLCLFSSLYLMYPWNSITHNFWMYFIACSQALNTTSWKKFLNTLAPDEISHSFTEVINATIFFLIWKSNARQIYWVTVSYFQLILRRATFHLQLNRMLFTNKTDCIGIYNK